MVFTLVVDEYYIKSNIANIKDKSTKRFAEYFIIFIIIFFVYLRLLDSGTSLTSNSEECMPYKIASIGFSTAFLTYAFFRYVSLHKYIITELR